MALAPRPLTVPVTPSLSGHSHGAFSPTVTLITRNRGRVSPLVHDWERIHFRSFYWPACAFQQPDMSQSRRMSSASVCTVHIIKVHHCVTWKFPPVLPGLWRYEGRVSVFTKTLHEVVFPRLWVHTPAHSFSPQSPALTHTHTQNLTHTWSLFFRYHCRPLLQDRPSSGTAAAGR